MATTLRTRLAGGLAPPLVMLLLGACTDPSVEGLSPEARRGRQVYLAQCTACHASDPAQDGPVGPAVKGASRELLEARVLRGEYPPGYVAKRASRAMAPMPHLAGDIPALAAYLR